MRVEFLPLKEIVSLVIDYRGKTPHKLDGEWATSGYRALSALNVKTRGLVAEDKVRYVEETIYKKWMKEEVVRGDILITSEAPFGQVLQWNSDEKIVLSQRLFALRIKPNYSSSYIYQYMASDFFYGELKARATGSTVEGLRQPALMKCRIAIPSLPIQRRIASILSAYDNLIENNNKRIRLLEQMAENLYKEWFVRFRFPGHENTEFENGLPKGWKKGRLGDVLEFQNGFAFKSETFQEEGRYSIVTIKNVQDNGFDGSKTDKIDEVPLRMPKYCYLKEGDILLSLTGNVGRVCRIFGKNYLLNQRVAKIKAEYEYFIYSLLKTEAILAALNIMSYGTAQLNLSPIKATRLKIIVPPKELQKEYNQKVSFSFKNIDKLKEANENLSRQRDLLLPRLMSGKLEVNA